MKFLTFAAAALVGLLAVTGPAEAQGRHDGWRNDRGHHNGWNDRRHGRKAKRHHARRHDRHCRTVWRHHRKVRVCR